jgi:hypothetical protein
LRVTSRGLGDVYKRQGPLSFVKSFSQNPIFSLTAFVKNC